MRVTFVSADRKLVDAAATKLSMYLSEKTIDMYLLESPFDKAISAGLIQSDAKRSLLPVEAYYVASFSISLLFDFLFSLDRVTILPLFPVYFYSIATLNLLTSKYWQHVIDIVEPVLRRLSEVQRLVFPDVKIFFIETLKNTELNSKIYSDLQMFKFSFTVLPGIGDYDWKEFLLL